MSMPVKPSPKAKAARKNWIIVGAVLGAVFLLGLCFIGLLAAIAVPNFLEAKVISKVSRTRSDLRVMQIALDSYKVDHSFYPAYTTNPADSANASLDITDSQPTFRRGSQGLNTLTTPTAYMSSYLPDAFARTPGRTFCYYVDGKGRFAIWGAGPDGDYDFKYTILDTIKDNSDLTTEILRFSYDPTNGTHSGGDIIRLSVL